MVKKNTGFYGRSIGEGAVLDRNKCKDPEVGNCWIQIIAGKET